MDGVQQKTQQYKKVLKKRRRTIKYVEPKTIHHWVDDNQVTHCHQCGKEFYLFLRRHHCRNCGRIFCYQCSNHKIQIPNTLKKYNDNNKLKITN